MIAHAITEIILLLCVIAAVLYAAYADRRMLAAQEKAFDVDALNNILSNENKALTMALLASEDMLQRCQQKQMRTVR
jgi:hypothetical protein